MNNVFFAYSSADALRAETMRNSAGLLRATGIAATTWEDLDIEGRGLIPTICSAIQDADHVIAEVSDLNSNVLFEAEYALALGKRVWLAVDETDMQKKRHRRAVRP